MWYPITHDLRQDGHDVEAVAEWTHDPGDRTILAYAHAHQRVLVTLDKDFSDLIVRDRRPHADLLRLVTESVHQQTPMVRDAIAKHEADLLAGAIVTVEENHIRVRPPEE